MNRGYDIEVKIRNEAYIDFWIIIFLYRNVNCIEITFKVLMHL